MWMKTFSGGCVLFIPLGRALIITFALAESLGLRNKILRKIEDLKSKMKSASSNIPEEFLCPITCEIMKDPVIASGNVFTLTTS